MGPWYGNPLSGYLHRLLWKPRNIGRWSHVIVRRCPLGSETRCPFSVVDTLKHVDRGRHGPSQTLYNLSYSHP